MLLGGQTFPFTPSGTQYQDYTFGPVTATAASQTVSFMAVPQAASTAATVMLDNVRVVLSAAPFTPAALSLYPATVTGGTSSLGTVTLSSYAPPAGVVVALQSDNPAATVAASVTVPGGQRSAAFTVSTTDVPAATTATISATAGGVTQTATLTITQNLSLTAAATGSTKVTLYWNGITGASGYNVYRGTVSGGPYALVASNITTADPGPGMTGSFMYSDISGLATGTEYFYVVKAIQSGAETMQSNEASATPDAGAIPWDSGDAAQIVSAVNATAANDLQPDDDGSGGTIPQQVGVLFIGAPDGVVYMGNSPDGAPPQAYPPSGHIVGDTLVSDDGTVVAVPEDNSDSPSPGKAPMRLTHALPSWSYGRISPRISIPDSFPYQSTPDPTGIYRKIESVPGYSGLSALVGLPSASDPQTVRLYNHPSTIVPANGGIRKNFPTVGDIYSGGFVALANGAESYPLDAGLQLVPHLDNNLPLEWSPIVYNHDRLLPNDNVNNPATADKVYLDGSIRALPVGNQPRAFLYKMAMRGELIMQFLTPNFASVRDHSVRLHFSVALAGVGTGLMTLTRYNPNNNQFVSSTVVPYITLEYFHATGWHKIAGGNNHFVIKRVNSLAQVLNIPNHAAHPGAPVANAPSNPGATKGYLADGSYIRAPTGGDEFSGAYWGSAYSESVQLYSPTAGWESWTDDSARTNRAGSYPARGGGAISYNEHNPFFWENNISLTAQ